MIDGVVYEVSNSSDSRILVYVDIDESMALGEHVFIVQEVYGMYNSEIFTYHLSENNQITELISGEISLESIRILDLNYNEIEYLNAGQQYYIELRLYNPTPYEIRSVYLYNGRTVTPSKVSEDYSTIWILQTASNESYINIGVNSYTYFSSYVDDKQISVSNKSVKMPIVNTGIIDISTPEELQNMQSNHHYRLINDIDLTDFNWTPIDDFTGVLDGNGYTISHLNIIGNYLDENPYLGLFKRLNYAVVKDLTILDVNFIIVNQASGTDPVYSYVGAVAGFIENSR
jgi:hypothetical protein